MVTFPDGFLWGAASAPHQVEGGNTSSDMWELEFAPGSGWVEPSGDTCDHYHRYPEDIALIADLGFNAYRFGVEWARIEPEDGYVSIAALDHYKRMVTTCHEHGITPVVTYNHFSLPRWFSKAGGWEQSAAPERFASFSERVTTHMGDLVDWVCTINEPNVIAMLVQTGMAPVADTGPWPRWHRSTSCWDRARGRRSTSSRCETPTSQHVRRSSPCGGRLTSVGPSRSSICRLARVARSDSPTRCRVRNWTGLTCQRDDDFVGVQTYRARSSGPTASCPSPTTRRRPWWVRRSTRRPWSTPCGAPPSGQGSRCSSPRTASPPPTTRSASPTRRRARRPGRVHGRRHRRARLPALDTAGQLRVGVGLPSDLRAHRGRPHDIRPYPEAIGALAR